MSILAQQYNTLDSAERIQFRKELLANDDSLMSTIENQSLSSLDRLSTSMHTMISKNEDKEKFRKIELFICSVVTKRLQHKTLLDNPASALDSWEREQFIIELVLLMKQLHGDFYVRNVLEKQSY